MPVSGVESLGDDVGIDEDAGSDDPPPHDHGGIESAELSAKGHAPRVRTTGRLFQTGRVPHIPDPMDIFEAISTRRSIKTFTDRPVSDAEIRRMLQAAVQAPNHRMTQPWRFYVLGPEARAAYGRALGRRKAKRVDETEAAEAVIAKVEANPSMEGRSMTMVLAPLVTKQ